MAKITAEVYGFTGEGATLKEAKAAAQDSARVALSGSYEPKIVQQWGATLLFWRTPRDGYCYRIFGPQMEREIPASPTRVESCVFSNATEDRAWESALTHFLSVCAPEDCILPDWVPDAMARDIQARWDGHKRYREGKAAGLNDNTAHRYMCGGWYRSLEDALADQSKAAA